MRELNVLVVYDIPDDKVRNKIGEKCKDYGLSRVQFTAFAGKLNKERRDLLAKKLKEIIGGKIAKLIIQPFCETCSTQAFEYIEESKKGELQKPKIYFGMKVNKAYRDFED
ncbi:MAG: CRISPR-associated endonuclease Cas2 [Endomicrobia bacterium]|nr:CRISPR-associated endonuclease Cas2 [Endomicrobiia bacterium]